MKESIFNIHMENNGHKLLFNSLYCGLCEIDDTYFEVLKKCNTGMQLSEEENELKLMAVEAGYFVEDDKDEIDFLNSEIDYLKKDIKTLKKKNKNLNRTYKKVKKQNKLLLNSSSWKITKPLRLIKKFFQNLFN